MDVLLRPNGLDDMPRQYLQIRLDVDACKHFSLARRAMR
jgi:hypothetical protein